MTGVPAGYRGAAAVTAALAELAGQGARVAPAGRTVRGADVVAVEVGPADAPATAILAGLHPIEWIGVEVALALLARLVAAPPRDRRIVALPWINVDGYVDVEADLIAGRRRWRRGNLGADGRGVDLNRNFPVDFRVGRRLPTGWNYGGPAPLSEPETAAVAARLRGAGVDRAVSLHSFGNKILTPWGGRWRRPERHAALTAAAHAVAARMPEPYDVVQSSRWVPGAFGHGMELDWLHGELGALALLVECTGGGARGATPRALLSPFTWFNPPAPAARADAIARSRARSSRSCAARAGSGVARAVGRPRAAGPGPAARVGILRRLRHPRGDESAGVGGGVSGDAVSCSYEPAAELAGGGPPHARVTRAGVTSHPP
ncbi:MAG: hypothetical protein H6708_26760 [Kofleriaceae bacterium]|nr:hypothetical protein [Kofleriaceae bacterium]